MDKLIKKLQIKESGSVLLLNLPGALSPLAGSLDLGKDHSRGEKPYDLIMVFSLSITQAEESIKESIGSLAEDGLYWFCYPKKSSKNYSSDLNRDLSWPLFEAYGFRPVRQISLNDDWSAIRVREQSRIRS